MIGETIRLGFDATKVKRGLANVMGGFGKLNRGIGRVTRQIGIGAARRMGSDLFGMMVNTAKAIPNEIQKLSNLNKEMIAMSQSTGIAADEYLALREAIAKTTGLDPDEATDFVRDVSERLGEAASDLESTPSQGLQALGFSLREIIDLGKENPADQLKQISTAFKELQASKGTAHAMFMINEVLGEIGKKMVPLFLNYDERMESARDKTALLSSQIKELDGELESVFDIKMSLGRKFSEVSLAVVKAFKDLGNTGQGLAEWIDGMNFAEDIKKAAKFLNDQKNIIDEKGFLGWIKEIFDKIGQWLSNAISNGIKKGVEAATPHIQNMLPAWMQDDSSIIGGISNMLGFKPDSKDGNQAKVEKNTSDTVGILNDMLDVITGTKGAVFAK